MPSLSEDPSTISRTKGTKTMTIVNGTNVIKMRAVKGICCFFCIVKQHSLNAFPLQQEKKKKKTHLVSKCNSQKLERDRCNVEDNTHDELK